MTADSVAKRVKAAVDGLGITRRRIESKTPIRDRHRPVVRLEGGDGWICDDLRVCAQLDGLTSPLDASQRPTVGSTSSAMSGVRQEIDARARTIRKTVSTAAFASRALASLTRLVRGARIFAGATVGRVRLRGDAHPTAVHLASAAAARASFTTRSRSAGVVTSATVQVALGHVDATARAQLLSRRATTHSSLAFEARITQGSAGATVREVGLQVDATATALSQGFRAAVTTGPQRAHLYFWTSVVTKAAVNRVGKQLSASVAAGLRL